jgi:hypothetical protein
VAELPARVIGLLNSTQISPKNSAEADFTGVRAAKTEVHEQSL